MKKKVLSLVLAMIMVLSLAACGSDGTTTSSSPSDDVTDSSASKSPDTSETAETRVVTGDDGTEVEIPYTVTKVAPLIGAFAQMTQMLTVGEGKIVAAATSNISDYFKEVFPEYVESNPNNYDASSVEDLISAGTQVCYGPTSIFSDAQIAQLEAAGIAYVVIDNMKTVENMSNAFMIIGEILGEEESARAQEFVEYYQGNIDLAAERTADIAETDKVTFLSLFYSADAYTTINKKDISNEYITAVGAVNISADYSLDAGGNSLTVDAEQIVAWNPQFIMVNSQAAKEAVLSDSSLASVDAVVNDNVQVCPKGVYLWSVRSGEGSMLPLWLGTQIYPELFGDIDLESVVREFFETWYNYNISDDEIQNVLSGDADTNMTR